MGEIASYPLSVWQKGPQALTPVSCRSVASAHLATLDKSVVGSTPVQKAPHGIQGVVPAKMKRGHVSKACTNCRKMHAGCDLARPCSRCVFHRMESSCVDIPRKKRVSKKKQPGDHSSPDITTAIVIDTRRDAIHNTSSGPTDRVSKDSYSDLFGEFSASSTTSSLPTVTNPSTAYFPTLADIVGSDSDSNRSLPHTPSSEFFSEESNLLAAVSNSQPPKKEVLELKEEMDELRQSNVALESRLNSVTQELTEMRQKMQQMLHLLGGFLVSPPTPNSSLSSSNNSSRNSSGSSLLGLPLGQDFPDL